MTDWDSEAARDVLNHGTTISQFRLALGATLARLAEVEAERDAARRETAEARDDALTAAMNHNAVMRAVMAERDGYRDAIKRYDAVHDNLAAENARLRQVVEAAETLAAAAEQSTAPRTPLFAAFLAAVDAYRAGQKRSERVIDELKLQSVGPDGTADFSVVRSHWKTPETAAIQPESQDQAEPAVASTNTAQAQRGPQGKPVPDLMAALKASLAPRSPWGDGYRHGVTAAEQALRPPADPPGLDAAIEAAARAYYDSWNETFRASIGAAVRAAAPALRAGALREAADEWEARGWTGFARLRQMADRIGGAT